MHKKRVWPWGHSLSVMAEGKADYMGTDAGRWIDT